jgi:hypothetical protein
MSSARTETGAVGILGLQAGEDVKQRIAERAGEVERAPRRRVKGI